MDLISIEGVDLFAGAGGFSTALVRAAKELGLFVNLSAVNHWDRAIETHSANHDGKHYCVSMDAARPEDIVPGGRLDILLASPECTHHSQALGGKPVHDQRRSTAWCIPRWLSSCRTKMALVENVPEFKTWGPVDPRTGRPVKSRKGEYFRAWVGAIRGMGYHVEWRDICCADYGDPTTRKRLFIQIMEHRLGKITWPEPTHAKPGQLDLMGTKPWRTAREIIDWDLAGPSIFKRKKPLAAKTMARIEIGLRRFGGPLAEAFIVVLRNHGSGRSLDEPLPTVCAGGSHLGIAEPRLTPFTIGQHGGSMARSVDLPIMTLATGCAVRLFEPRAFTLGQHSGASPRSVDDPISTICTTARPSLIEPHIVTMKGRSAARSIDAPVPTVCTRGHHYLAEPHMIRFDHGGPRPAYSLDEPVRTITTKCGLGIVEADAREFIVPYYGTGVPDPVDEPLATVTARARFALAQTEVMPAYDPELPTIQIGDQLYQLDIRFRMLAKHELAAAMGFPTSYQFKGNGTEILKQIGNAVPGETGYQLSLHMLKRLLKRKGIAGRKSNTVDGEKFRSIVDPSPTPDQEAIQ